MALDRAHENRTNRRVERALAAGQDASYRQSFVDRFGNWLSATQIRRRLGSVAGKDVADIGCGFHAAFTRTLLDEVASATLVDLSLSAELKSKPRVRAFEGTLPSVLDQLPDASFDLVICNNVLEHLWEPELVVAHVRRVLRSPGRCFLNVPSWTGKAVLETSAFRLGLSAKLEIDDHKLYYEPKELWALLVRSGFKPSQIVCKRHKFGLNTFAVCSL